MPKTALAFGELLWDVFPTTEALGGAPSNFAYRINSLGHNSRIITRLGNDDRGKRAAEIIRANGMSLDYIQWDDNHPTGTVPVEVDAAGVPTFTILPNVAYDYIATTPKLLALAAVADCICFGTLIQRSETSRHTLYNLLDAAPKALKVLDLNLRKDCYTRDTIAASLKRADILKLNEGEAETLASMFDLPIADFAATAIKQWNLQACVITLGPNGAIAANNKGALIQCAGHKVNVVDTIGSGDAFTAGFVHCYLEGHPLLSCCDFANALGALVAQTKGGMTPVSLDEIHALTGAGM